MAASHSRLDPFPCRARAACRSGLVCPAAKASRDEGLDDVAVLAVSKQEHAVFPGNSHGMKIAASSNRRRPIFAVKTLSVVMPHILEAPEFACNCSSNLGEVHIERVVDSSLRRLQAPCLRRTLGKRRLIEGDGIHSVVVPPKAAALCPV